MSAAATALATEKAMWPVGAGFHNGLDENIQTLG